MTTRNKQSVFIFNVAKLIHYAYSVGFELTGGELYRTEEQQAIHLKNGKTKAIRSKHQDRLAVDFNLFLKGVYLTKTQDYKEVGAYWVSLNPLNRWGGDWNKNGNHEDEKFSDGNHFEMV